jgi:hypothetical protein
VGARGRGGSKGGSGVHGGLTTIHNDIGRIYKELSIQMKRMAQLQAELDAVRLKVERMMGSTR